MLGGSSFAVAWLVMKTPEGQGGRNKERAGGKGKKPSSVRHYFAFARARVGKGENEFVSDTTCVFARARCILSVMPRGRLVGKDTLIPGGVVWALHPPRIEIFSGPSRRWAKAKTN